MKASTTPSPRRVKRWGLILGTSMALMTLAGFADLHDFHFSRTDARWNPDSQTVQTTVRVFTDDLELALRNHHELSEDVKIWLGDENEWALADSAIHAWLQAHLTVALDQSHVRWSWVGKEVELDVSYLYVESQPLPHHSGKWRTANTLLFSEFEDQVNEVHLHDVGTNRVEVERREMLNADWPSFEWDSAAPAPSSDED
jgi:hypothetical protein